MAVGDFITVDNTTTTATLANDLISYVKLLRLRTLEIIDRVG